MKLNYFFLRSAPVLLALFYAETILSVHSNATEQENLGSRKSTNRLLQGQDCSGNNGHYNIQSSSCVCEDGFFGQKCEVNAIRLAMDEFTSVTSRTIEKMYFFVDIPNDNNEDLTLTIQSLPKSIKVSIGQPSPNNYFLPDDSTTIAYYESSGLRSWEINIPMSSLKSNLQRRVFVSLQTDQPSLVGDFKMKISSEGSSTLTIILIVVGTISVILNIIGCVYFIRYKLRREVQEALRQQMERNQLYSNGAFGPHADRSLYRIHADPDAPLTQEDLNLYFPEANFDQLKSSFGQAECPICLEEFKSDSVCRQLYCEHIFHMKCIHLWLAKQQACPTCKKNMTRKTIGEHFALKRLLKKEETALLINENNKEHEQEEPPQKEKEEKQEIEEKEMEVECLEKERITEDKKSTNTVIDLENALNSKQ